ncbi:MAG TPA: FTR1 family protein [Acidimicrobiales bacterium]|nr:FTR1 family protein [Acidimicrobiales bacterium]
MVPALLIMVREGFEAALVVSIVFAYLRSIERRDLGRSAWLGVGGAVVTSVAIGIVVHLTIGALEGDARKHAFAVVSVVAAGVLTWMIFWMRRQSRAIKGDIEHRIDTAIGHAGRASRGGIGRAVTLVAFLAVLREGVEAALFLIAAATSADGTDVVVGAAIGIAIACGLGVLVYAGGTRIPMKTFFTISGIVIILFATGLLSKTVFLLQSAGDFGTLKRQVFDASAVRWLTPRTEFGKFLGTMFGWESRPTLERVVAWFTYVVPVTYLFLRGSRSRSGVASSRAPGADAQPLEPVR